MAQKYQVVPYDSDSLLTYSIRISNAVDAIAGNSVTSDYDDARVRVSVSHHGQKRRTGIQARGFKLGLPATAPATGYSKTTFVPIVNKGTFDTQAILETITYEGGTWTVIDKIAEA